MPPERKRPHHPAPQHLRSTFDPYNSSSTGHQRADNPLARSTGWRNSRTAKLAHQLRGGYAGGRRVADAVGAGSPDPVQRGGWKSVADMLRPGTRKPGVSDGEQVKDETTTTTNDGMEHHGEGQKDVREDVTKKLFDGLCFYINGSTAPWISDHRLKQLIAEHGGRVNIMLGRRSVTHVVLGSTRTPQSVPSSSSSSSSSSSVSLSSRSSSTFYPRPPEIGGGLAATKIEQEIRRVGGCGVKYVGVQWVLQSVEAGKLVAEASFLDQRLMQSAQRSVYDMFKRSDRHESGTGRDCGDDEMKRR